MIIKKSFLKREKALFEERDLLTMREMINYLGDIMDIKKMFLDSKALLEGHFQLSSGLHSEFYLQSAKVLQNIKNAEILRKMIADKIKDLGCIIDIVVAPAMGGLIIGHEVARALGKDFVFTERVDSQMMLRRGFVLEKWQKIALIEDVFTTGKSTKEVMSLLDTMGAETSCCASIVDRSGGKLNFGLPQISLLTLDIKSYKEENCPLCQSGKIIEKPGSRFLKK